MTRQYMIRGVWAWLDAHPADGRPAWLPQGVRRPGLPQMNHGYFSRTFLYVWLPVGASMDEIGARLRLTWASAMRRGLKVTLDDLHAAGPA